MPIYTYECEVCGMRVEEFQTGFEPLVLSCPKDARHGPLKRIMSVPSPFQWGGTEGKLRKGTLVKKRNDAYATSPKGQDEAHANAVAANKRLQK